MKTIKASEFVATCLQLMDEVAKTGESVVITKNGKPVSQRVPIVRSQKRSMERSKAPLTFLTISSLQLIQTGTPCSDAAGHACLDLAYG